VIPVRDESESRGISCPACGCRHFYTTHTEPLRGGRVRRRKVCRYCGRKIVTYESPSGRTKRPDCYM